MERMICIVGPTASGKTKLSVALARKLGAEIVSCDSMQIYRGMDIGTAKPTREEMGDIPHHMIDIADPGEDFSVGRYVRQADACVQDIFRRGKPVIVVGGTGLYVDSLVAGRDFASRGDGSCRERLTAMAREQGIQVLMEQLRQVDPESAARIHPSNEKRVIRALEIYLETGKTMTQHDEETRQQPAKYHPRWIGLDYVNRSDLYARIDRRVEEMVEQGLLSEVEALLHRGIDPQSTAMQAIGYKELAAYFRGEDTLTHAVELIQQGSRRYAKRQRTWFRRNPEISWIEHPSQPVFEEILARGEGIIAAP